jgi:hypothetical protein
LIVPILSQQAAGELNPKEIKSLMHIQSGYEEERQLKTKRMLK